AVAAAPHPVIAASGLQPGVTNYFLGRDPRRWRTHVQRYDRVTYRNLYPGVDLAYHGEESQLEFDFIVAAHAEAKPIDLAFEGARSVSLGSLGDLVLSSSAGEMRFHKPFAYQQNNGVREPVDAQFVFAGSNQVRFALGPYDHSRELVIDPTL